MIQLVGSSCLDKGIANVGLVSTATDARLVTSLWIYRRYALLFPAEPQPLAAEAIIPLCNKRKVIPNGRDETPPRCMQSSTYPTFSVRTLLICWKCTSSGSAHGSWSSSLLVASLLESLVWQLQCNTGLGSFYVLCYDKYVAMRLRANPNPTCVTSRHRGFTPRPCRPAYLKPEVYL